VNGSDPLAARITWTWTRLYTRGLPGEERDRRRLEIRSDIWEQLNDADEPGAGLSLLGRFLRGIPADVRWRYRTLLEQRGVRQRSQEMTTSLRRNWWVILASVMGTMMLTGGFLTVMIGGSDDSVGNTIRVVGASFGALAGALVLAGLIRRPTALVGGSRMIFAGSLLSMVGGALTLMPMGLIVIISGFWTGNLQLTSRSDEPRLSPLRQQQVDMTRHWFVWFGAAAALFAIGWLPLIFDDPESFTFGGWLTWVLSWLGAIVTAGIGVVLGSLRLVVRHRTRLA
jgi:hypothetical protein